jgi:hypothetical protein
MFWIGTPPRGNVDLMRMKSPSSAASIDMISRRDSVYLLFRRDSLTASSHGRSISQFLYKFKKIGYKAPKYM